jgi:hypothetical protein
VKGLLRFARQATLLHFAIAGGLLFVLHAMRTPPDQETIHVTREIAESAIRTREELAARSLSTEERAAVVAGYISDEVLLREAYARDLHRRDGLVRKRLLELMRFLLVEEPPEPTDDDLRAYLAAHADVYQTPAAVTFSHVYFSADEGGIRDDERVLARLRAGADFRKLGDRFWLGPRLERYAEPQLVQLFGTASARLIFELPLGHWSGPVPSKRGIHFVRVDERHRPEMPTFADLAPLLRPDWLASKREELLQQKVDELRRGYRVEIQPGVER